MQIYTLSDFHFDSEKINDNVSRALKTLCEQIRSHPYGGNQVLFILLGDIVNQGNKKAFFNVRKCLDELCGQLHDFDIYFEMVPGNHDRTNRDISAFDQFSARYGIPNFESNRAYARQYSGINFIFADTTWGGNHDESGHLDLSAIESKIVTGTENVLVCHHALTQFKGGVHDCVIDGDRLAGDLRKKGIRFVIHGHTHQADFSVNENTAIEFGCGSMFQSMVEMPKGTNNQFARLDCRDGRIIAIERVIFTADGNGVAIEALYPQKRTFADPEKIGKIQYAPTERPYIIRKIIPYESNTEDTITRLFSDTPQLTLMEALQEQTHILLLGDAGCGKSIVLAELAHTAGQGFYFPVLIQLKDYLGETVYELLPESYRELYPNRLLLLFDGYDEMLEQDRIQFNKVLNRYVQNEPGVRIVITSRSNFCKAEYENNSRTFSGFKVYYMCEIDRQNQTMYLCERGIVPSEFFESAEQSGVTKLLESPFYLRGLADIYMRDSQLPRRAELMDRLIQLRFLKDDEKFPDQLSEHQYQLFVLLRKLSFSMQLMHRRELSDGTEYQRLFSPEERTLMHESGLLERNGDKWQFAHNNFREYLAAKELSQYPFEKQLSFFQQNGTIYPHWVNTLGYLCGLEKTGGLLCWLTENAQNALVKFEKDRVDRETRNKVFQALFSYYESRGLWFQNDLCSEKELIQFASSLETIRYLMDKISHPVHHISRCTALKMLSNAPSLFGMEESICSVLLNCCEQNVQGDAYECYLSMCAVWRLHLQMYGATDKIVALTRKSEAAYIRYGLYKYLVKVEMQDTYYDVFIEGLRFIHRQCSPSEYSLTDETLALEDGLKTMSNAKSVSAVLHALADDRSDPFYGKEAVFHTLFQTAATLYQAGETAIVSDVTSVCFQSFRIGEFSALNGCFEFFRSTHTEKPAIVMLSELCEQGGENIGALLSQSDGLIDFAAALYIDDILPFESFAKAINYCNDAEYSKYRQIIMEKEKIELPVRVRTPNYEEKRKQRDQAYFSILFDQQAAKDMLDDLLSRTGDASITVDDLRQANVKHDMYSPLMILQHAMYSYVSGGVKAMDFFETIDWDEFVICEAFRRLQQTEEKATEEQVAVLTSLLEKTIGIDFIKDALHTFKKYDGLPHKTCCVLQLAVLLDICLPESCLLELTQLPDYYFSLDHNEKPYSYLMRHLDSETLKRRIIGNLEKEIVTGDVLTTHIQFCGAICCDAAVRNALQVCKSGESTQHDRYEAFKYLHGIKGAGYVEEAVLPYVDGELLCMIAGSYKDISTEAMKEAMEAQFRGNPSGNLQMYLISYGSRMALEQYANEVQRTHKLPENNTEYADGPTSAIGTIGDPSTLPILGKLMEIVCAPDFKDAEFGGLRSGIIEAFYRCCVVDPDASMSELIKHEEITATSDSCKRMYEYIKEAIIKQQRFKMDVAWTIERVEEYWRALQSCTPAG